MPQSNEREDNERGCDGSLRTSDGDVQVSEAQARRRHSCESKKLASHACDIEAQNSHRMIQRL